MSKKQTDNKTYYDTNKVAILAKKAVKDKAVKEMSEPSRIDVARAAALKRFAQLPVDAFK